MRRFIAGSVIGLLLVLFGAAMVARAQVSCDSEQQCADEIAKFTRDLNLSIQATTPLESEVAKLANRLKSLQASISKLNDEQKKRTAEIQRQELNLADQFTIFRNRVDQQYRYNRTFSPLVVILTSSLSSDSRLALKYTLTLAERDHQSINSIGQTILDLQAAKQAAADQAKKLASLQAELDKQKAFFDKEIAGAKKYQAALQGQIAVLTAKQQQIIAEKTGTAQTSVGEVPLTGDFNASANYNPGFSPAFAAFSFGAPHFKGMSQYGAYGRARSGQNYEAILKTYYGDIRIEKVDIGGDIDTTAGRMSFEDRYLKGIAEMPSGWGDKGGYEALKAQAIAARTYALSYVGWRMDHRSLDGKICVTEACQVWNSGKASSPPDTWRRAVEDTRGQVVVSSGTGNIFATWYASTAGGHTLSYTSLGHTTPSVWDTTSEWSRWADGAYESIKYLGKDDASPWFYKGWYKSRSGDSCGRSHPWLNQEEMADILNAWVVRRHASGGDLERVSPLGSCWSGNPFSLSEMREKAKSYGEEYTSISGVRVEHGNNGYTSKVVFQTNRGEVSIGGTEFKEIFNLRAPGRLAIKSILFDIQKR
jgi:peptidoglycan hydrolase-like amidase